MRINSNQPPTIQPAPLEQLPITTEFIRQACENEFTLRSDPPLSIVGQCFSKDAIQISIDETSHKITLIFPAEVSQVTRGKVASFIEKNVIPGYKVKAEVRNTSITDLGIKVVIKSGRQRVVDGSDDTDEDRVSKRKVQDLDALGNPIIYLHNPKLAQVIEPSLII